MSRLPVELLLHVFSYLSPIEDRATLASLCNTSKCILQLARPYLYFDLSDANLSDQLLLRTITDPNSSGLAQLIKKVNLTLVHGSPSDWAEHGVRRCRQDLSEQDWLSETEAQWNRDVACLEALPCIEHLGFELEDRRDYASRYSCGFPSVPSRKTLLATSLSTNLRSLQLVNRGGAGAAFAAFGHLLLASSVLTDLSMKSIDPNSLFEPVFAGSTQAQRALLSLKALTWYETDSEDIYVVELLVDLLPDLPSVRKFTLVGSYLEIGHLDELDSDEGFSLPFLTHFTACWSNFGGLEHLSNWILRFSPYVPALEALSTDIALHHHLPSSDTYPRLKSLNLNYPFFQIPPLQHIESFVQDHPPALRCVTFNARSVVDIDFSDWVDDVVTMFAGLNILHGSLETVKLSSLNSSQALFVRCNGRFELRCDASRA